MTNQGFQASAPRRLSDSSKVQNNEGWWLELWKMNHDAARDETKTQKTTNVASSKKAERREREKREIHSLVNNWAFSVFLGLYKTFAACNLYYLRSIWNEGLCLDFVLSLCRLDEWTWHFVRRPSVDQHSSVRMHTKLLYQYHADPQEYSWRRNVIRHGLSELFITVTRLCSCQKMWTRGIHTRRM